MKVAAEVGWLRTLLMRYPKARLRVTDTHRITWSNQLEIRQCSNGRLVVVLPGEAVGRLQTQWYERVFYPAIGLDGQKRRTQPAVNWPAEGTALDGATSVSWEALPDVLAAPQHEDRLFIYDSRLDRLVPIRGTFELQEDGSGELPPIIWLTVPEEVLVQMYLAAQMHILTPFAGALSEMGLWPSNQ